MRNPSGGQGDGGNPLGLIGNWLNHKGILVALGLIQCKSLWGVLRDRCLFVHRGIGILVESVRAFQPN